MPETPETDAGGKNAAPDPPKRKGMTPEERRFFERSFQRNEEALRRLAKL